MLDAADYDSGNKVDLEGDDFKNVLIIGGGGREHAIAHKFSLTSIVKNIFVAPGSHAISRLFRTKCVDLNIRDHEAVAAFCLDHKIDLVVVGPEEPLSLGIADFLSLKGISVFGPRKAAARIETDKEWAKGFMDKYGIPTARWKSFTNAKEAEKFIYTADYNALVVKASGLAAGKGVIVAQNKMEACSAVQNIVTEKRFGTAGDIVVIEELLEGEEVTVMAFCDGTRVIQMLPVQDHKRIFENDKGPNTGGMGAYAPCRLISPADLDYVTKNVLERAVEGFKKENLNYVGVLNAGLMLTKDGPKVLEFNCRFGDPETQVVLPLLQSDLYRIVESCAAGCLDQTLVEWKSKLCAVGVVMASKGYPESSSRGQQITGLNAVGARPHHTVFHYGTAWKDDHYETNGGRVLIAVAVGTSLMECAYKATKACEDIHFEGKQFRKDIAHKGIARSILHSGQLTYKQSGVDIIAGNELVSHIKPAAKSTNRSGVIGGLGGFGGLFDPKAAGFKDPLLVSGTDGVGTKLKIAQEAEMHNTIGIDLVAMCVNDVLAHGAEPLFFLDYFACGHLDVAVAKSVISGIAEGCRQAGCSLIGGETAEMPDMYPPGEYDVAGFCVGAVERSQLMPRVDDLKAGDTVIALPSSGVHSNGFSLVRKIMAISGVKFWDLAPFSHDGKTFGEELLTPTKIYVSSVIPAVRTGYVKAFAHITGGGLLENVPRILPNHLGVELDAEKWKIPEVFGWLATAGGVNDAEMLRTFNCGVGGILLVAKEHEPEILDTTTYFGATVIGKVVPKGEEQIVVKNFAKVMEAVMRPFVPHVMSRMRPKKRVGVLISGSGTNLQALIDATQRGDLGAEIVLVLSNKDKVEGLARAKRANIPTKVISHKDYPNRADFDAALHTALEASGIEIVCLAGFMRILTGEFTAKWKGRLINVHPALLPSFKGTHAQRQALDAGVKVSGCTVHFVEEAVDGGHIIVQEAVPIDHDETEESLIEKIKKAEHRAFPRALELVAKEKVGIGADNKLEWSL